MDYKQKIELLFSSSYGRYLNAQDDLTFSQVRDILKEYAQSHDEFLLQSGAESLEIFRQIEESLKELPHSYHLSFLCRSHSLNLSRLANFMRVLRLAGRAEYIALHRYTRNLDPISNVYILSDQDATPLNMHLVSYSRTHPEWYGKFQFEDLSDWEIEEVIESKMYRKTKYSDVGFVPGAFSKFAEGQYTVRRNPISFSHGIPSHLASKLLQTTFRGMEMSEYVVLPVFEVLMREAAKKLAKKPGALEQILT